VVDIDHFKNFNDTFGHDAGDQVLRMVAMRLANVTGGGRAYRIGGEEFAILFQGKSAKEALPHLEFLRQAIAESAFRLRGLPERRSAQRGPDRRGAAARRRAHSRKTTQGELFADQAFVTVSMGIAESGTKNQPVERVIQNADQALYRAKGTGRNRVETAGPRSRASRTKRSIA
jgi:GGDEF domain-containing protein